jgi:short subunit fatty acids transporter
MLYTIIIAVSVITIVPVIIYALAKGREKAKRVRVSEEGYETAYDILFTKVKSKKYRVA